MVDEMKRNDYKSEQKDKKEKERTVGERAHMIRKGIRMAGVEHITDVMGWIISKYACGMDGVRH
jgi:hypothetical protein